MSPDELERLARFLRQGLTLERETQVRLVEHALGAPAQPHQQGCAFHRGEECDCRDGGLLDMRLKEVASNGPGYTWFCHGCGAGGGPYASELRRDEASAAHARQAHP